MVVDDVLSFGFDIILGKAQMLVELSIIAESDSPDFYSCTLRLAAINPHRWAGQPNLDHVVGRPLPV
jgi:hypothetical protein